MMKNPNFEVIFMISDTKKSFETVNPTSSTTTSSVSNYENKNTYQNTFSLLTIAKTKLLKDQGLSKHDVFKKKKSQENNKDHSSYAQLILTNHFIGINEKYINNYLCGNDKPLQTTVNITISLMSAESILIKLFSFSQTLYHFKSFLIYNVGVSRNNQSLGLASNTKEISSFTSSTSSHSQLSKEKIWDIYRKQRQNQQLKNKYLTLTEFDNYWVNEKGVTDVSDKLDENTLFNSLNDESHHSESSISNTSDCCYPITYSVINKDKESSITLPYGYAYAIHLPFTSCSHGLIKDDRVYIGPIRLTRKLAYQAAMLEICHYLYNEQILDSSFLLSLKAQGVVSHSNHYYSNEEDYYRNNKKEDNSFRYLENISYIEKNKKLKLEGNYISDDQRFKLQLEHGMNIKEDEKEEEEEKEGKEKEDKDLSSSNNDQEVDRPDSLSEYKRLIPSAFMADDLWDFSISSEDGNTKNTYHLQIEIPTHEKTKNQLKKVNEIDKDKQERTVEEKKEKEVMDVDPKKVSEIKEKELEQQTLTFISEMKDVEDKWKESPIGKNSDEMMKETNKHEFYVTIFSFGPELELYTRNALPCENAFFNIINQPSENVDLNDISEVSSDENKEDGELDEELDENEKGDSQEPMKLDEKKEKYYVNEIENTSYYFKPAKDRNLFLFNSEEKQRRIEPRRSYAIITKRPIPTKEISNFCVWLDGKISCKVKVLHWNDQTVEGSIGIGNCYKDEIFDYKISSDTSSEPTKKGDSRRSKHDISSKGLY